MAAMKRMVTDVAEGNAEKYQRMDALQIEVVCDSAATAAMTALGKHFQLRGGKSYLYAELYTFIEGQLERLLGE